MRSAPKRARPAPAASAARASDVAVGRPVGDVAGVGQAGRAWRSRRRRCARARRRRRCRRERQATRPPWRRAARSACAQGVRRSAPARRAAPRAWAVAGGQRRADVGREQAAARVRRGHHRALVEQVRRLRVRAAGRRGRGRQRRTPSTETPAARFCACSSCVFRCRPGLADQAAKLGRERCFPVTVSEAGPDRHAAFHRHLGQRPDPPGRAGRRLRHGDPQGRRARRRGAGQGC